MKLYPQTSYYIIKIMSVVFSYPWNIVFYFDTHSSYFGKTTEN